MIQDQQARNNSQNDLQEQEDTQKSGKAVRFVYNVSAGTRELAHSAAVPNAVHYTPFHPQMECQNFAHLAELACRKCGSYINLYCQVIKAKKLWICCICKEHNKYPQQLVESMLQLQTYDVTSQLPSEKSARKQRIYLLLIDLCISHQQMKSIKTSLLQFVNAKASQHYEGVNIVNKIGIITFSKFIYCYELSSALNTVICISAQQNYHTEQVKRLLSLQMNKSTEALDKYFLNAKLGLEKLEKRIKNIKAEGDIVNPNDPLKRCRAKRGYGQALNIALSLSELVPSQCRIINLVGGPCTHGIGTTIRVEFKKQMRSISQKEAGENMEFFQSSAKFYQSLREKAEAKRTILDMFVFSIEETGLTEMYELLRFSGGLIVLGEEFSGETKIFQKSFRKAYIQSEDNQLACSLTNSCVLVANCSGDIKINGALGLCKPIENLKGKEFVSEKPVGFGDTNMWYAGSMDCYKTLTFFYQLANAKAFQSAYYIQFKIIYHDYWGFHKTRITTVKKLWDTNVSIIADNFDQEAAIVALARWYLHKVAFEPKSNLRQWLDKLTIRWASFFATYIKGDIESFILPNKMKFLPQFVYHFRRNPIFRRVGLSLDELTYHSHSLNRQTIQHCVVIIQPALISYSIEKPYPSPVRLEQQEMKNSVILLLDTYFHVLLWYGQNIEFWETQEYHKQKQYQHVKELIEAPNEDKNYLINARFPTPGYYKTSAGHSKQRILKSKISPALNQIHNENTLTDDKSVYAFMKALVQIIVNNKNN